MKCPHCLENFVEEWDSHLLSRDSEGYWNVYYCNCANNSCGKIIIKLNNQNGLECIVIPKGITRKPVPAEVPKEFSGDYKEACLVLADSPKASAALARRNLQHLLREVASVTPANLHNEIQQVLDSHTLPSDLAEQLDAVRVIGNFAAHPTKSTSTGEIVEVENNEAEWNLDVLEEMFDFYFVRPARTLAKKNCYKRKANCGRKRKYIESRVVLIQKPPKMAVFANSCESSLVAQRPSLTVIQYYQSESKKSSVDIFSILDPRGIEPRRPVCQGGSCQPGRAQVLIKYQDKFKLQYASNLGGFDFFYTFLLPYLHHILDAVYHERETFFGVVVRRLGV